MAGCNCIGPPGNCPCVRASRGFGPFAIDPEAAEVIRYYANRPDPEVKRLDAQNKSLWRRVRHLERLLRANHGAGVAP